MRVQLLHPSLDRPNVPDPLYLRKLEQVRYADRNQNAVDRPPLTVLVEQIEETERNSLRNREAILEAARAHDLPVYGHVPGRTGLKQALTSGQKSFEHLVDFTYALLPDDSPARGQLLDMLDLGFERASLELAAALRSDIDESKRVGDDFAPSRGDRGG